MAIVFPTAGLIELLGIMVSVSSSDVWTIHLYQNNYTPDGTETVASFTGCNYDGYAPQLLGDWNIAGMIALDESQVTTLVAYTFTKTIGPNINYAFGYWVDDSNGNVVFSSRFPQKARFDATGDNISVQPTIVLSST